MKIKFTIQKSILVFILIALIFLICLKLPIDPDMGWHMRNGQILWESKSLPRTDLYTYTMPNFPVIFHEWVTDIIMYLIYSKLGLLVLSIFFALITLAAFIIVARSTQAKLEYQLVAALLGAIASIPIIGARAQMITLLGLALIILIFYRYKNNPKSKLIYYLPLIFVLWVNLHGGFSIGLFILVLFLGFELVRRILVKIFRKVTIQIMAWQNWWKLAIISLISGLVTLINPYGYRVYEEVFRTLTCTYARQNILEWLPVKIYNMNSAQFTIYLVLFVILLFFAWRKIDFSYLIITAIFGYLAFSSWRNVPLFILVTIPFWVYFVESLTGQTLSKFLSSKWATSILLISLILLGNQKYQELVPNTKSVVELTKKFSYPYEAVQWLKAHPQAGHVFNEYNWGGFLIWQLPEVKLFIDGRMACWEEGDVKILKFHQDVLKQAEGWSSVFERFNIDWAILGRSDLVTSVLKTEGWQELYSDDIAVILRKK